MTSLKAVLETVDAFLTRESDFSVFNNFDEAMRRARQRLPDRDDERPGAQVAWALFELARDHFYLMRVTSRKVGRIAEGIAWAGKAENVTVQLSLARSILEHTAALAFQVRKLGRFEDNLSRQADLAKLMTSIKTHHEVVRRLYYGESPRKETAQFKQFRVEEFREAIENDYPDEPRSYEALCEFVHPNHGSNYLGQRFLGSNHIRRRRRACRTMCG
jgi:hypothetical protein